ncbi:uncharacterized protein LOC107870928 isoform X5 [Capsicum annuum]|uniref:uncharacterized protein LOC107870928 isoform X5 n=1 Tax=Capsicum annuum TaxID=4072 RepID=UPI001FB19518|nr:uncharacterized protein LOC107870928 isoform X5 [Capsicum annuum]
MARESREITTKDNANVICSLPGLPKKTLQDLCRKHRLSPYKTKPNLVSSLVTYTKGADELLFKEMKTKDSINSISRLSKKELQDLCRKHGLSPYKTKPNLLSSLVTYFNGADELLFKEMKTQDSVDSISRLSKKELQDLCRKHGLSPYKTKPNLLSSLVTYIKGADELLFKEMKTQDSVDSISRLSKKELQDLCRKHGLSPYKTKPNLLSSLVTYIKGTDELLLKEMKTKDSVNSLSRLSKKELQNLCRKHGLSPYKTKPNLVNTLITYVKGAESFSIKEMKTNGSGNSIYSLPKKKLQELCKKYGLSPYKTKPILVDSLINYFKKADIETSEGNEYKILDSSGIRSTSKEILFSRFILQCDEKGFERGFHSPRISFSKNAFTSDMKSMRVPSFEFSVLSEDGINLIVDLNSCPSDSFKRLEKKACVCHNLQNHKLQSFCQEIQYLGNNRKLTSSFLWKTNSDSGFNSGHAQTVSSASLRGTADVVCHTENTDDASLGFSATTKSCDGSVETYTRSERKKESPSSFRTICGVQNMNITDVNTFMGEEEITCVGLNTLRASEKTEVINRTVNVEAYNPENSKEVLNDRLCKSLHASLEKVAISSPADVPELKHNKNENQNRRLCDVSCLDSERQGQRSCVPEKLIVLSHLSTKTDFIELDASEIGSHHQHSLYSSSGKDCFRNLVDAAESLRSIRHCSEDSCSIFPDDTPSAALEARDSHANRTEASKELLKKQKEQLSHGGKKRKRHDGKSDNVHHCNDGRILRSAKRLPRRSIRLVSKQLTAWNS